MYVNHKLVNKIQFIVSRDVSDKDYSNPTTDFCDSIQGKAYSYVDPLNEEFIDNSAGEFDKKFLVGQIDAKFIYAGNDEYPLWEILDAISSECEELISFFDEERILNKNVLETIKKDNDEYHGYENFLFLEDLSVNQKYRGFGIGKLLIKNLLIDHSKNASFAFLKAFPKQYSGHKKWSTEERKQAKKIITTEFKDRDLSTSQKKLVKLYSECGFKLIKGNKEHMIMDLFSEESHEFLKDSL
tara:strand:- start:67 stop:792 length:726 start_codon:yes stop_codon:yes gene_type:complete